MNFEHIRELPKTEDDKYGLYIHKMIAAIFRYKCSFPSVLNQTGKSCTKLKSRGNDSVQEIFENL